MSDQSSTTSSDEKNPITIVLSDFTSENEEITARTKIVYNSQKEYYLEQTATCMTYLLRKMTEETRKFNEYMKSKEVNETDEKRFHDTLKRSTKIIMRINDFNDEINEAEKFIIPVLQEIYKP